MANSGTLAQIEKAIGQLSRDEQLLLIERLVQGLRGQKAAPPSFAAALAEMAADPDIQRELKQIEKEFAHTEMDGLEQR